MKTTDRFGVEVIKGTRVRILTVDAILKLPLEDEEKEIPEQFPEKFARIVGELRLFDRAVEDGAGDDEAESFTVFGVSVMAGVGGGGVIIVTKPN